jgi:hypothetical protein
VFQVLEGLQETPRDRQGSRSSACGCHAKPAIAQGQLGLPRPVESPLDTTPRR